MSHTVCIPSSIYDKVFENRIKFRMKINSIFKAKKMERIKGTSTWDTNHDGKIWICNEYYAIHAHKCENLRFFCLLVFEENNFSTFKPISFCSIPF